MQLQEWTPGVENTTSCTGHARSKTSIFKAIPAAEVCERARIAALPLCEIVLPSRCRVSWQLGRTIAVVMSA
jgi:hypothetical protein